MAEINTSTRHCYYRSTHATAAASASRGNGCDAMVEAALSCHPCGTPRVIERCAAVDVVVTVCPLVSVMMSVATVGEGVSVGIALTFMCRELSSAEYVLVPRPVLATLPAVAVTDVLNVYAGVVYVGVEIRKFGSVVATVAEYDARNTETSASDSVSVVEFDSG